MCRFEKQLLILSVITNLNPARVNSNCTIIPLDYD